MSKYGRPRLRDVRRIYRLLGECAELGSDSAAWRVHMLEGLSDIVGARIGLYMHIHHPLSDAERLEAELVHGFLDAEHLALWEHYRKEQAQRDDPFHLGYFRDHRNPLRTRSLSEVVGAREWRDSRHCNDYVRACGLGDRITTSLRMGADREAPLQTVVLHRDASDGDFASSGKYLVKLLHHEIAAFLGKRLVLPSSRRDTGSLPRRMAQVLASLLEGKSEKQIASCLGISPHTVNRHVQRLYQHFGVNSRAKLIAAVIGEGMPRSRR